MAILVPRWLDSSWQVRLQMCLKVCMVIFANRTSYQSPNAQCDNFLPPSGGAAKARIQVHLDLFHLNPGLRKSSRWGTGDIVLCVWALVRFAKITMQNFRHICSRTCQLKSSHLGAKIAITFRVFGFRRRFLSQIVQNCQTRLSRPFLATRDLFFLSKVMTGKP